MFRVLWLQEASTVATLVDDLKALRHHMSDKAWRVNKRQRLALGCLRHPTSQLTREMLKSSGTPPVAETLPRTSLSDIAQAALPLAAWNTRNRDDLVRSMLHKGEVAQAKRFLQRLAVNYPTDPRTWISLAELRLFYEADYAAARIRCRAAIEALNISESQLNSIISLGHDHSDRLVGLCLIRVHVRAHPPFLLPPPFHAAPAGAYMSPSAYIWVPTYRPAVLYAVRGAGTAPACRAHGGDESVAAQRRPALAGVNDIWSDRGASESHDAGAAAVPASRAGGHGLRPAGDAVCVLVMGRL